MTSGQKEAKLARDKTSVAVSGRQEVLKVLEKYKAFTKMKLSLAVHPSLWSLDSTTCELRNVFIYVNHVKHT